MEEYRLYPKGSPGGTRPDTRAFIMQENTWWDARTFLAKVIYDVLVQYKQADRNGYPVEGDDITDPISDEREEELVNGWEASLDKMIAAFNSLYHDEVPATFEAADEMVRTQDEGLLEFAVQFRALWD